jgi:pimeloyl-ACP methyl ester carboxylesterase
MPYINYNNKKVFYQIKKADTKVAIVFIHGSGENSNTWKHQFDLELGCNLIAVDLPSHNKSESFENLSLNLYVDVVKTLVDSLELENIVLCGHSLGGAVIQSYYFKYPKDVSGLILVGTGARLRVSPLILDMLKNNYNEYLDNMKSARSYY